jgi:uncharacterized cupredoxin-like copper-binding protein
MLRVLTFIGAWLSVIVLSLIWVRMSPNTPQTAQAGTTPTVSAAPSSSPSTAAAPTPSAVAGPLTIVLTEWKVAVPPTMKAGKATFTIKNGGMMVHELLVFRSDLAPAAYPTNKAGGINEEGAGIKLLSDGDNLDPGASQTRTVDLTPGKYLFVCNLPGHFREGMFTVVTVQP